MLAGASCRSSHWGILCCAIFIQLLSLARASLDNLDKLYSEEFGRPAQLTADGKGVVPSKQTPEQRQRQRELRRRLAAEANGKVYEPPSASSLAEELEGTSSYLNASSKVAPTRICQSISIKGCGDWGDKSEAWQILRSQTDEEVTHKIAGDLHKEENAKKWFWQESAGNPLGLGTGITSLLLAIFGISMLTVGMFSSFFAPFASLVADGEICSCTTVMSRAIAQTYLSSTLAMSIALGITGGVLVQNVAHQTGVKWLEVQLQQEMLENFNWVMGLEDKCNSITFQGNLEEHQQTLAGLEEQTNEQANDAIEGWCDLMNHIQTDDNSPLWHWTEMPTPTICKHKEQHGKKGSETHRTGFWKFLNSPLIGDYFGTAHKRDAYNCLNLLQLQDEEITYQAARTYFDLDNSQSGLSETTTDENDPQDTLQQQRTKKSCGEMLSTGTPVSTAIGAICKKNEAFMQRNLLSQEEAARWQLQMNGQMNETEVPEPGKVRKASSGKTAGNSSLLQMRNFARVRRKIADAKQRLLELEKERNELLSGGTSLTSDDPRMGQTSHANGNVSHPGLSREERAMNDATTAILHHEGYSEGNKPEHGKQWKVVDAGEAKYQYVWTEKGSEHAGPAGGPEGGYFEEAPEVGSPINDDQVNTMIKKGWDGKDTMAANGFLLKEPKPWEDKRPRWGKIGPVIPVEYQPQPPLTPEALHKSNQIQIHIKRAEEDIEKWENEKADHLKEFPQLRKMPIDFQIDDMPDTKKGEDKYYERTAIEEQGPEKWEPHTENADEDIIPIPQINAVTQVEASKAQAIHDCLAFTSCEMLKKDLYQLQGMDPTKTVERKMYYNKPKEDMLQITVQRCLSHTFLYGPAQSKTCTIPKDMQMTTE